MKSRHSPAPESRGERRGRLKSTWGEKKQSCVTQGLTQVQDRGRGRCGKECGRSWAMINSLRMKVLSQKFALLRTVPSPPPAPISHISLGSEISAGVLSFICTMATTASLCLACVSSSLNRIPLFCPGMKTFTHFLDPGMHVQAGNSHGFHLLLVTLQAHREPATKWALNAGLRV